ncbi:MAG: phosphohydrolase [Spirochaetes bacterium]|nr:MAG: phosphohydrolase [Spirochaetota bacterium]
MNEERLKRQLEFLKEADKLKTVFRQTYLVDGSRRENDAEHSWELAFMVILLSDYAGEKKLDILKLLKMTLIHDIVEIDAGDTYIYDKEGMKEKEVKEAEAAGRLFSILPDDQCAELKSLWEEFERRESPEAKFAAALDRFQPLLHNYYTRGRSWNEHGIDSNRVLNLIKDIEEGSAVLYKAAKDLVYRAVDAGFLKRGS